MLTLRDGRPDDLEAIMNIYRRAQDYMIRTGNPTQWGRTYPAADLIRSDMARGVCKVMEDEAGIHGVFALFSGEEPTYAHIEGGQWLNGEPYVTIHRIAGDGQVGGVFQRAADYCKGISPNVRIDTHADNRTMQHLIEKNGFRKCGIIYVGDGSPRLAYQWTAR